MFSSARFLLVSTGIRPLRQGVQNVVPRVRKQTSLVIQQYVGTHTISQNEVTALLDNCVTNTPSVKMSCPQNSCLSLYCRKNITFLTVGLLRISEVKVKVAP